MAYFDSLQQLLLNNQGNAQRQHKKLVSGEIAVNFFSVQCPDKDY
jgi:hypothetical protein